MHYWEKGIVGLAGSSGPGLKSNPWSSVRSGSARPAEVGWPHTCETSYDTEVLHNFVVLALKYVIYGNKHTK